LLRREWRYVGRCLVERGCHGVVEVAAECDNDFLYPLRSHKPTAGWSYQPAACFTSADPKNRRGFLWLFFAKSSGPRHKKTSTTGQQGNRRDDEPGDEDLRPRVDLYRAGNTGKSEIFIVDVKGAETHQDARV
jgi:hypothetical protein